jgi:hypothetical protein
MLMRRLPPWLALQALLLLLLSTGCAAPSPPVVRVERMQVPASLLACLPQPEPPPAGADDRALGRFLLDLAEAGEDCRSRLARVAEVVGK